MPALQGACQGAISTLLLRSLSGLPGLRTLGQQTRKVVSTRPAARELLPLPGVTALRLGSLDNTNALADVVPYLRARHVVHEFGESPSFPGAFAEQLTEVATDATTRCTHSVSPTSTPLQIGRFVHERQRSHLQAHPPPARFVFNIAPAVPSTVGRYAHYQRHQMTATADKLARA